MVTVSVIKADIGGFVGHSQSHPEILDLGREQLERARQRGLLTDFHVSHCGDDMFLIMTHDRGENNEEIHHRAWDTFIEGTELAKKLKLYGAGQDLLADAFSGNIRGAGPGSAEMEIEERPSEPILVFMGDKMSAAALTFISTRCSPTPSTRRASLLASPCTRASLLRSRTSRSTSRSPSTPRTKFTTC